MSNLFLKVDGIDGECTDASHLGWINVLNFSLDVLKGHSTDLIVTKKLDASSPKLAAACAKGDAIDEILVELFTELGYSHQKTIIRNIPSKSMPLQNSPTNKRGEIQDTMHQEYIVVMKKS